MLADIVMTWLIKVIKNEYPDAIISFTGHSLGGGLASIMAVFFNKNATVFDLAPFKNSVINSYCVDIYYQYAKQLLEEGVISGIPPAFTKYYDDLEEVKQEVYRYAEDSVQRGILKKINETQYISR